MKESVTNKLRLSDGKPVREHQGSSEKINSLIRKTGKYLRYYQMFANIKNVPSFTESLPTSLGTRHLGFCFPMITMERITQPRSIWSSQCAMFTLSHFDEMFMWFAHSLNYVLLKVVKCWQSVFCNFYFLEALSIMVQTIKFFCRYGAKT